jgi:hypothetical protein
VKPVLITLLAAVDIVAVYGAVQTIRYRLTRPFDYRFR